MKVSREVIKSIVDEEFEVDPETSYGEFHVEYERSAIRYQKLIDFISSDDYYKLTKKSRKFIDKLEKISHDYFVTLKDIIQNWVEINEENTNDSSNN